MTLNASFVVSAFGQQRLMREGEVLGPEAFGLNEMFDLPIAIKISIHIAMSFVSIQHTLSSGTGSAHSDGPDMSYSFESTHHLLQ